MLSFDFHPKLEQLKEEKDTPPGSYEPWPGSLGYTQYPNGPNPDVLYDCPEPGAAQFERMPCNTAWDEGGGYISAAPRSHHVGGVNATFLDGHVGFLPNNIDEYAMLYMVSTNEGEIVNERY